MKKPTTVKTGETVPISGQYKPSGTPKEMTFVKGNTVPPNPHGGRSTFKLVDVTKHKSK